MVVSLGAGTSQTSVDADADVSVRIAEACAQVSATFPCRNDTVPVGGRLDPDEPSDTVATRRTLPGDDASGAPVSVIVVDAGTTVTSAPCDTVTLLAWRVPGAGVNEAPNRYGVALAARADSTHDAVPCTTGTD